LTFDHNNLSPKIGPSSTNTPKSRAKGTNILKIQLSGVLEDFKLNGLVGKLEIWMRNGKCVQICFFKKELNEWIMDGQSWPFKRNLEFKKKIHPFWSKQKNLDCLGLWLRMALHHLIQLLFLKCSKHWATKLFIDFHINVA
jgi:hypothetical protein